MQKALAAPKLVSLAGVNSRLLFVIAGLQVGDEVAEVGVTVVFAAICGD